jgi:tRNA pseudouridine55 synthase
MPIGEHKIWFLILLLDIHFSISISISIVLFFYQDILLFVFESQYSITFAIAIMKIDLTNTDWKEGAMLLVDKPLTWTSFQAGNKIKWLLNKAKIGHSGTLDPLATGLLVFCTGKWTKKLTEMIGLSKEYTGTITIGSTTASFDLESATENHKEYLHITEQEIRNALPIFTGPISQLPPIFSAIKQNGQPIYHAARKGEEVIVQPRNVTIHEFEITNINLPNIEFRIACSSGTYIRSIANDFGAHLGVGGHLSSLRRTKIGEYSIADAWDMDEIVAVLQPLKEASLLK